MTNGDLIYIPQDVTLFNFGNHGPMMVMKTSKPTTGVFLGENVKNVHVCNVFVDGVRALVDKKYVYPMENRNVS
tara:strand:+ start:1803 stop:2024 length:222 start_codon:yes stop_codon:yes gene_type:complete